MKLDITVVLVVETDSKPDDEDAFSESLVETIEGLNFYVENTNADGSDADDTEYTIDSATITLIEEVND